MCAEGGCKAALHLLGSQPHSNVRDPIPYYMLMLDKVRVLAEEFDICISTSTSIISRFLGRWQGVR
jgi:hypothetical protein